MQGMEVIELKKRFALLKKLTSHTTPIVLAKRVSCDIMYIQTTGVVWRRIMSIKLFDSELNIMNILWKFGDTTAKKSLKFLTKKSAGM